MTEIMIENPTKIVNTKPTIILFSSALTVPNQAYCLKKTKSMRHLSFLFAVLLVFLAPRMGQAFCFEEAGEIYGIPPRILWAIAKVESNFKADAINRNVSGSYDFGLMQINSSWEDKLGDDLWRSLGDPCLNVKVGAWILGQCLQRYGYTWKGIGCYNAVSDSKRAKYAQKVSAVLKKMNNISSKR